VRFTKKRELEKEISTIKTGEKLVTEISAGFTIDYGDGRNEEGLGLKGLNMEVSAKMEEGSHTLRPENLKELQQVLEGEDGKR